MGLILPFRAAPVPPYDGSPVTPRPHPRVFELSAAGVDDTIIGITSDPSTVGFPQGPGLRIPAVLPGDTGPLGRPRYLFCLSTRVLSGRSTLVGMRQGLTIGVDFASLSGSSPPIRPIELNVTTPDFRFVDGNVSWHLVIERQAYLDPRPIITDSQNWSFLQSDGPAMLYATFANSNTYAFTGAPVLYMQGLTAYTPPQVFQNWAPVDGDLFNFYDLRFPWNGTRANRSLQVPLEAHTRVSLYASILQTNPQLRTPGPGGDASSQVAPFGTPPEEAFITAFTASVGEDTILGPNYWRVFGSLIWEDEE